MNDALDAEVAELADALDSGSSARKGVGVRVPPSAPRYVNYLARHPPEPPRLTQSFVLTAGLIVRRSVSGFVGTLMAVMVGVWVMTYAWAALYNRLAR
jgi:hypothetical protein